MKYYYFRQVGISGQEYELMQPAMLCAMIDGKANIRYGTYAEANKFTVGHAVDEETRTPITDPADRFLVKDVDILDSIHSMEKCRRAVYNRDNHISEAKKTIAKLQADIERWEQENDQDIKGYHEYGKEALLKSELIRLEMEVDNVPVDGTEDIHIELTDDTTRDDKIRALAIMKKTSRTIRCTYGLTGESVSYKEARDAMMNNRVACHTDDSNIYINVNW